MRGWLVEYLKVGGLVGCLNGEWVGRTYESWVGW